jgi:ubiquinone/menaquinone biosynthesis C-methylase UbiE
MIGMDTRTSGIARLFDRVSGSYDNSGVPWFTPIARHLVDAVEPAPGQRALDIGCGRGAVLFPLAEAVGPTGTVTGIDVAPGMIEATRTEVAARNLSSVDVRLMDAGRPTLQSHAFDVALASMVVFFLPDPVAALRSWRDLLAPGGRLGLSTQGPRDPGWRVLDEIFLPHLPPVMLQARASPVPRMFATVDATRDTLTEAGYRSIRTSTVDMTAVFDDAGHWVGWSRSHAGRAMWDAVPNAELPGILAAARRHLDGLRGADGRIRLGQKILLTVAEPGHDAAPLSAQSDMPGCPGRT